MIRLIEHTRRPDISFCRNGRIHISARVSRALSLSPGEIINIAVADGEYLLFAARHKNNGRYEAQCYRVKKGEAAYRANSVRLCRAMLAVINQHADRVAFITGEAFLKDGIVYIPIITHHPLI